jgi:hypothetical protein
MFSGRRESTFPARLGAFLGWSEQLPAISTTTIYLFPKQPTSNMLALTLTAELNG